MSCISQARVGYGLHRDGTDSAATVKLRASLQLLLDSFHEQGTFKRGSQHDAEEFLSRLIESVARSTTTATSATAGDHDGRIDCHGAQSTTAPVTRFPSLADAKAAASDILRQTNVSRHGSTCRDSFYTLFQVPLRRCLCDALVMPSATAPLPRCNHWHA